MKLANASVRIEPTAMPLTLTFGAKSLARFRVRKESANLLRGLLELSDRASGDDDVRARLGIGQRRGRADAAAGAGHDGDPVVESEEVENAGHRSLRVDTARNTIAIASRFRD